MSRLTYGAYGASAYDLPNVFFGSYKSKGYFIKNKIHELNIKCKIDIPEPNVIKINLDKEEEIIFCGRLHHTDYFNKYGLYRITTDGQGNYIFEKYEEVDGQNTIGYNAIDVKITDSSIIYNPCAFRIKFIAMINGAEKIIYLNDNDFINENFIIKKDNDGYCTLKNDKTIKDIVGATSFRYEIEFMTNDDEKTYYLDDITFFGKNNGTHSNVRQGYLVFDLMKYLEDKSNKDIANIDILNISYDGIEDENHEIYVASKIYYDDTSNYATRWSSRYLNGQNKLHLMNSYTNNTTDKSPFLLYYDPSEHVDQTNSNINVSYKIKNLVIGGGVIKKDPEDMSGNTYYSNLPGDLSNDKFVSDDELMIISPINTYVGYKDYIEYHDLNKDGVISEIDRNVIRNNIGKETLLKGGYICLKMYDGETYEKDANTGELISGPLYIYEENIYKIDLQDYTKPIVVEFYFNRFDSSNESPYINFIGFETYNEYRETVKFGPSERYECLLNNYYYHDNYGSLTFRDKTDDNGEIKNLTISDLNFQWPYWFTSTSLENIEENAIQIITQDRFIKENPNISLYLSYNATYMNHIVGADSNTGESSLLYKGYQVITNNNGEVSDIKDLFDNENIDEYYMVSANLTNKMNITCEFNLDEYSTIFSGKCKTRLSKEEWESISLKMIEANLSPFKTWLYVISLDKKDNVRFVNTDPNAEEQQKIDGLTKIESDSLDVCISRTNDAPGKVTYNQYIYNFKGAYNLGSFRNNYERDILASEIPVFENLKKENIGELYIDSDIAIEVKPVFDENNQLKYISVVMNDENRPVHYLNTKGLESKLSSRKTINRNGNIYDDLYITYDELSRELGRNINKASFIEIHHLTDNTLISYEMKDDGILFAGREKYDLRNEWVPKIKCGYYNIGKEIRFFNPEAEKVKLKDIYPFFINGILKTNGPYGTMGHKNHLIKNMIRNPEYKNISANEYIVYKENF